MLHYLIPVRFNLPICYFVTCYLVTQLLEVEIW